MELSSWTKVLQILCDIGSQYRRGYEVDAENVALKTINLVAFTEGSFAQRQGLQYLKGLVTDISGLDFLGRNPGPIPIRFFPMTFLYYYIFGLG